MTEDELRKLLDKALHVLKYYGNSRLGGTWMAPTYSTFALMISSTDLEQMGREGQFLIAGRRARDVVKEIEDKLNGPA